MSNQLVGLLAPLLSGTNRENGWPPVTVGGGSNSGYADGHARMALHALRNGDRAGFEARLQRIARESGALNLALADTRRRILQNPLALVDAFYADQILRRSSAVSKDDTAAGVNEAVFIPAGRTLGDIRAEVERSVRALERRLGHQVKNVQVLLVGNQTRFEADLNTMWNREDGIAIQPVVYHGPRTAVGALAALDNYWITRNGDLEFLFSVGAPTFMVEALDRLAAIKASEGRRLRVSLFNFLARVPALVPLSEKDLSRLLASRRVARSA